MRDTPWPLPALGSVWDSLADLPELGDTFEMHRGLQWKTGTNRTPPRASVWSREERPGYKRGLRTVRSITQFALAESPVYLDVRAENLRANAIELPWTKPKLIVNAGGLSTGPWRVAAAADRRGLMFSQQFIGLWPRRPLSDPELSAFAAVLNGPVANAFVAVHNPAERVRISQLRRVPIPAGDLSHIGEPVAEYMLLVAEGEESGGNDDRMATLLTEIDALALGACDLPARLEKRLLGYFGDARRPVAHAWRHWDETHPMAGLTLAERLSGRFRPQGSWILDVFRPLPDEEARILQEYGPRQVVVAYLLDTSVLSALLDTDHPQHRAAASAVGDLCRQSAKYVSTVSLGELRFGVRLAESLGQSNAPELRRALIDAGQYTVLEITAHTSEAYSELKCRIATKY